MQGISLTSGNQNVLHLADQIKKTRDQWLNKLGDTAENQKKMEICACGENVSR